MKSIVDATSIHKYTVDWDGRLVGRESIQRAACMMLNGFLPELSCIPQDGWSAAVVIDES